MPESLRDKLRRLRNDPPNAPSAEARASVGLPSWFVSRLQAREAVRGSLASAEIPPDPELRTCGEPSALVEERNACGAFGARVTRYDDEHQHGTRRLCEVEAVERETLSLLCADERLREFDPREAIYLDIETTGLAGGAGTKAFLVGLGVFRGASFELWQGFLRGPEEERAMLQACVERIDGARGIVSFFGKAFDRHRLEDKMRMHGLRPPFEGRPHLDLYHPCKRLYGRALPNSKLQTMERALVGFERERDLAGAFAPAAWYDFLSGRPHLLEDVFRHNRDDVLSLVSLCAHVGSVLQHPAPSGGVDTGLVRREAARCEGLASSFARSKRWSECAEWSERARLLAPSLERARELLEQCALALRRAGREAEARERWREIAADGGDARAARAWLELARGADEAEEARGAWERAAECARANCDARGMASVLARAERALARATAKRARR